MNQQEQNLLNTTYTATREQRAEIDALKARVADIEARLEARGIAPTPKENNVTD